MDKAETEPQFEEIIKPKILKENSRVGLITPAGPITRGDLQTSIKNLEKCGFRSEVHKNATEIYGYMAGNDKQRAEQVNDMFSDPKIDAILCARGGYGTQRILDNIDYENIRNNPKPIIGFSDITALLSSIYKNAGIACFHGPVGKNMFSTYTRESLVNVMLYAEEYMDILPQEDEKVTEVIEGEAEGVLYGGNLSLLASMVGTKYDVPWKDKIIFIEEVNEAPYRIDRLFTQLLLANKFDGCKGIMLGHFARCESTDLDTFKLVDIVRERLGGLCIPTLFNFSFGHVKNNCTIPIGVKAHLDTYSKKITLLESPLVGKKA